jgi:hypothetical protein
VTLLDESGEVPEQLLDKDLFGLDQDHSGEE